MFLTISMKLKISTYRVLSEKKARSCNNPTNSLFVMSISVCAHCHFLAGDGNVQRWEQPFIFGGLSFYWTVSEKTFCISGLSCRYSPPTFMLGAFYLVLLWAGGKWDTKMLFDLTVQFSCCYSSTKELFWQLCSLSGLCQRCSEDLIGLEVCSIFRVISAYQRL